MSIYKWVESAPPIIRSALSSVVVVNFLQAEASKKFQMAGRYDGAMSETCKINCREESAALLEFLSALRRAPLRADDTPQPKETP